MNKRNKEHDYPKPGRAVVSLLSATGLILSAFIMTNEILAMGGNNRSMFEDSVDTTKEPPNVDDAIPTETDGDEPYWMEYVYRASLKYELDPRLIKSVIKIESDGNVGAYSECGAVGLMQVMPRDGLASGFMCENGPCFADRPTIEELLNPEFNIDYGTQLLAQLIEYNSGDVREGLKDYGPMDVGYEYADSVLRVYQTQEFGW